MPKRVISLRVDEGLLKRIDALVRGKGTTRTDWFIRLAEQELALSAPARKRRERVR